MPLCMCSSAHWMRPKVSVRVTEYLINKNPTATPISPPMKFIKNKNELQGYYTLNPAVFTRRPKFDKVLRLFTGIGRLASAFVETSADRQVVRAVNCPLDN